MKGLGEATLLDVARLLQAFAAAAAQRLPGSSGAAGRTPPYPYEAAYATDATDAAAAAAATAAAEGSASAAVATTHSSSSNNNNSSSSSSSSSSSEEGLCAAPHRRLFIACVETACDRIQFAAPAELAVAAQAFGLALLQSQGDDAAALLSVLQHIRYFFSYLLFKLLLSLRVFASLRVWGAVYP